MQTAAPGRKKVNIAARRPLYLSIQKCLRDKIVSGELVPGDQIDTETKLAEHFGASVGTIRKAQEMLIREGLIIKEQGRGCFVSDQAGRQQQLLSCCGLDVLGGDISAFYTSVMRTCHQEAASQGYVLNPIFLPAEHTSQIRKLCSPDTLKQYAGVMFFGCGEDHALLSYARLHDWPNVHLVQHPPGAKQVFIGLDSAMAHGLRQFQELGHREATVLCCSREPDGLSALADMGGLRIDLHVAAAMPCMSQVEAEGYHMMSRMLAEDTCHSAVLILDDIVARGATRAMMERPADQRPSDIIVASSQQTMIPLGLPATYLVHDAAQLAAESVRIVLDQVRREPTGPDRHVSRFVVAPAASSIRPGVPICGAEAVGFV